jgi:predicted transcriptional regulator
MTPYRLPADDLEYAVLAKLWELDAASVREVHERLGKPEGLVYTTIAKVIDRLRGKGLVERKRSGKAFVYRSTVARDDVERARAHDAVSRLLGPVPRTHAVSRPLGPAPRTHDPVSRLLGLTPRAAVAALVDAVDTVDPLLLEELERAVAARRRSKRGA